MIFSQLDSMKYMVYCRNTCNYLSIQVERRKLKNIAGFHEENQGLWEKKGKNGEKNEKKKRIGGEKVTEKGSIYMYIYKW